MNTAEGSFFHLRKEVVKQYIFVYVYTYGKASRIVRIDSFSPKRQYNKKFWLGKEMSWKGEEEKKDL